MWLSYSCAHEHAQKGNEDLRRSGNDRKWRYVHTIFEMALTSVLKRVFVQNHSLKLSSAYWFIFLQINQFTLRMGTKMTARFWSTNDNLIMQNWRQLSGFATFHDFSHVIVSIILPWNVAASTVRLTFYPIQTWTGCAYFIFNSFPVAEFSIEVLTNLHEIISSVISQKK